MNVLTREQFNVLTAKQRELLDLAMVDAKQNNCRKVLDIVTEQLRTEAECKLAAEAMIKASGQRVVRTTRARSNGHLMHNQVVQQEQMRQQMATHQQHVDTANMMHQQLVQMHNNF